MNDQRPASAETSSKSAYPDIDHVAHFLPDIETAGVALTELGFTLTPFSEQSHRLTPDGPLVPAGTANRCIMLRRGYLEFLTPTHDTPNAGQLRAAMQHYTGVHLLAFGTQNPDADFQRLSAEGFQPLTPLALQRQVGTVTGETLARFTVVRVPPQAMAEGRVQYCQHHTREAVWQPRWLTHANHAAGLAGVILCVADPAEVARRYARFTGLPVATDNAAGTGNTCRIDTARGNLLFAAPDWLQNTLGEIPPALPWIAGYVLDSDNLRETFARTGGSAFGTRCLVKCSAALGGLMIFQAASSEPLA